MFAPARPPPERPHVKETLVRSPFIAIAATLALLLGAVVTTPARAVEASADPVAA